MGYTLERHRGRRRGGAAAAASAGDGAAAEGSGRWRYGGGGCIGEPTAMDQRERTAVAAAAAAAAVYGFGFGPDHSTQPLHQARALRPYNQALKHRLEDASWVCCSHYGLRLIVVRTATLLMRRLLVWCERLSCSSELWS